MWSAPELLTDAKCVATKECDMYSYGMILYEILTRENIFGVEARETQLAVEGKPHA